MKVETRSGFLAFLFFFSLSVGLLAACQKTSDSKDVAAGNLAQPGTAETQGLDSTLPEAYRGKANPLPAENSEERKAFVDQGLSVFQSNCISCHGERGDGRGQAAAALRPTPADLREEHFQAVRSDAYLFWIISEGKSGTAMPRWRGVLTEEERWALVAYVRSLRSLRGRLAP